MRHEYSRKDVLQPPKFFRFEQEKAFHSNERISRTMGTGFSPISEPKLNSKSIVSGIDRPAFGNKCKTLENGIFSYVARGSTVWINR